MPYEIMQRDETVDAVEVLKQDLLKHPNYTDPFVKSVMYDTYSKSVQCTNDVEFDAVEQTIGKISQLYKEVEQFRKHWKAVPIAQGKAVDSVFKPILDRIIEAKRRYEAVFLKYRRQKDRILAEAYQEELRKARAVGELEPPPMLMNEEITGEALKKMIGWECIVNGEGPEGSYTLEGTIEDVADASISITSSEDKRLWYIPIEELKSVRALPKPIEAPAPPPTLGSVKSSDGTVIFETRRWGEPELVDPIKFAKAVASTGKKFVDIKPEMVQLDTKVVKALLRNRDDDKIPEIKTIKLLESAGIKVEKIVGTTTRPGSGSGGGGK